jgi:hypothetical protein
MKTRTWYLKLLIAILTLITTLKPQPSCAGIEIEPTRFNHLIFFCNQGEPLIESVPFLTVTFTNVTDADIRKIKEWSAQMDEAFRKSGGVSKDKDYEKILEIMKPYLKKFTRETTATSITICFPRINKATTLERIR